MYFSISSKQTKNVFFTDLVFINLSPLQKARDLSEASDLTKQDLTEQDILNEDQGVWIGRFQSNGRKAILSQLRSTYR